MIEADLWVVIVLDILLFGVLPAIAIIFARCWWNVKRTKKMMVAEIWEPNGDTPRTLVEPDPTGATVVVDNLVYRLPKELSDKEMLTLQKKGVRIYPRKRWASIPNRPLPPIQLRVESWEKDNPEPIRPFYGRVTEDGKFEDSLITVTSTEWAAQKNVIQGTQIAMRMQALDTWQQALQKLMTNTPSKMIVYIGIGIAAGGSIYCAAILYQLAMG